MAYWIILVLSVFSWTARGNQTIFYDVSTLEKAVYKISSPRTAATAFAIGPNLFVTNLHAIDGPVDDPLKETVLSNQNGEILTVDSLLRVGNQGVDLALFTTKESVSSFLTIETDPIAFNKSFFALGYPSGIFKKITMNEGIKYHSDKVYELAYDFSYFHSFLSGKGIGGASGSPVFNQRGKVVAILNASASEDTLFSTLYMLAVPSQSLQKLIQGNIGLDCSQQSLKACIIEGRKDEREHIEKRESEFEEVSKKQINKLALFLTIKVFYKIAMTPILAMKALLYVGEDIKEKSVDVFDGLSSILNTIKYIQRDNKFHKSKTIELFETKGHQSLKLVENVLDTNLYKAQLRFDMGIVYLEKGDIEKAIDLFSELGEKGHYKSIFMLGKIYLELLEGTKDYKKIHTMFELVIRAGYHIAFIELGKMYWKGLGVAQDRKKARNYFEQAIKAGYKIEATQELADLHFQQKNYKLAFKLYIESITEGEIHYQLLPLKGLIALGIMFREGLGLKKDLQKSLELFLIARNRIKNSNLVSHSLSIEYNFWQAREEVKNYPIALFEFGKMHRDKMFELLDPLSSLKIALELFEQASQLGHTKAEKELGKLYLELGESYYLQSGNNNLNLALEHFKKAQDKGYNTQTQIDFVKSELGIKSCRSLFE